MPTNCRPRGPSSVWARTNSGISSRQGSHQVAQKLTTRTLPRHCSKDCRVPPVSGRDSANNASARFGGRSQSANPAPAANAISAATPKIRPFRRRRFIFDCAKSEYPLFVGSPSIEPGLLVARCILDHAGLGQNKGHPLHRWGIAKTDVGTTLRFCCDNDLLPRFDILERKPDHQPSAVSLDSAEELIFLDLTLRERWHR